MKMNKKLIALSMGMMLAAATAVFASVAPQEAVLGGIEPGMDLKQAESLGGEVAYSDHEKIIFKSGLIVKVDDDRPGVVEEVLIKSGSLKTPAGLALGMSESEISQAYGTADKIDRDRDDTEYKYFTEDGTKKMEFTVRNGVITKISCELRN